MSQQSGGQLGSLQVIVELVTEGMDAAPVGVSVQRVCGSVWKLRKWHVSPERKQMSP